MFITFQHAVLYLWNAWVPLNISWLLYFTQLEEAAQEVADEVTRPRPVGEETVQDIQVMLKSDAHPASIRNLKVRKYS